MPEHGISGGDWPDIAGRLTPDGHVLPVRIYYEDTDFSGSVYHASYLRMLERGRSDFLRLLGVAHRTLAEEGLTLAVHTMTLTFHRPARIDDMVEIATRVSELTAARIALDQEVRRDGILLVEAGVTVVAIGTGGRPRRLPPGLRAAMERSAGRRMDRGASTRGTSTGSANSCNDP